MSITRDRLKELLNYDAVTGVFIWRDRDDLSGLPLVAWRHRFVGRRAGTLRKNGYRSILIDKRRVDEHRLAWIYLHGDIPPGICIDHINRDTKDNRIANLRLATRLQNLGNSRNHITNTWGLKGISPRHTKSKGLRWRAAVHFEGKYHHCGTFSTKEEAHAAYFAKAKQLFGEFARAA